MKHIFVVISIEYLRHLISDIYCTDCFYILYDTQTYFGFYWIQRIILQHVLYFCLFISTSAPLWHLSCVLLNDQWPHLTMNRILETMVKLLTRGVFRLPPSSALRGSLGATHAPTTQLHNIGLLGATRIESYTAPWIQEQEYHWIGF